MKLWKWSYGFGVLALAGGALSLAASPATTYLNMPPPLVQPAAAYSVAAAPAAPATPAPASATPTTPPAAATPGVAPNAISRSGQPRHSRYPKRITCGRPRGRPAACPRPPLGPTPLLDVKIFQKLLTDDEPKPWLHVAGWADFDYTYRSTGSGENNVAPVMNRFGDEFLTRQLGLYLFKPLDREMLVLGFQRHLHWRRRRLVPYPHRRRLE